MVLANGMVMDRDTIVDTLAGSPAWDSYVMSDEQLVPIGAGSAALVYRRRSPAGGADGPSSR